MCWQRMNPLTNEPPRLGCYGNLAPVEILLRTSPGHKVWQINSV
jgi:hypothetical protein